ncbi:MAG: hypothetical protein M3275_01035 [Thermoproteota archaeon]|nr:hypothetical protein [Thermoproteota archaeon]
MMFASIITAVFFSSATGTLSFHTANALTVSESIQFTSNNATTSTTELQEPFSPPQEAIANHLEMAREALRNGNLTMAIQEIIFAIELQSGISSDIGIAQNETQSRMELQTAPFPPDT